MGKIKSAIITAILVAAIVVLGVFATVSYTTPGSNGVGKFNSFISSIKLGGELSGNAEAVLYPEGVISASEYALYTTGAEEDKLEDYAKYQKRGSVYVDENAFEDYENGEEGFKADVLNDAKVLAKRFGEKGYSGYTVSVQDDYTVKVSVPTNFPYAAYADNGSSLRSSYTSEIERTIGYMFFDGELTLRNTEIGNTGADNIITPLTADVTSYFKSITNVSAGGNYAVRLNLTKAGRELFKDVTTRITSVATEEDDDKAIGFYIGDNRLIALNVDGTIDSGSFYIGIENGDAALARDYAIVLNSVANGDVLSLGYGTDDFTVVYKTSALGAIAPVYLGIALLFIIIAAIIYSVVRYKKLGLVNALMILIYSLAIIIALMLIEIQLTIAGAVTAVLGLALLCASNFALFENVRGETKKGKTMQSAVKSGYKNMLLGILEMHIILVIVALMLALICVGELASCGLIFFIATLASYVLYWFTRFMWYVLSSPVKDKFKFCGFTREEYEND